MQKMVKMLALIGLLIILAIFTLSPVGVGYVGNITHRVMLLGLGFILGYIVGYGEDKS